MALQNRERWNVNKIDGLGPILFQVFKMCKVASLSYH